VAKSSGNTENIIRRGVFVRESSSGAAVLFNDTQLGEEYWLPKSQIEMYEQDGFDCVSMPAWLWKKKQEELG
jgi:hypothetical protein